MASRLRLAKQALALAGAIPLLVMAVSVAHAGGEFGWADFIGQWAGEGVAVGKSMTTVIILIAAFLIGYGAPNAIPVIVPMALAAVIAANAETIAGTVGGGAAGGSIDGYVAPAASVP
jgi:hypothetical protein